MRFNYFNHSSDAKFLTKDGIYTVYLVKKNRNNDSFHITLKLIELSKVYLIVNFNSK